MDLDGFGVVLGSVWKRFGVNVESIWKRLRIDLGSTWERFVADLCLRTNQNIPKHFEEKKIDETSYAVSDVSRLRRV